MDGAYAAGAIERALEIGSTGDGRFAKGKGTRRAGLNLLGGADPFLGACPFDSTASHFWHFRQPGKGSIGGGPYHDGRGLRRSAPLINQWSCRLILRTAL
jgi:hypothetical protein